VVDAEHLGDDSTGLAVGDSLHRPLAAAFQLVSGSNGSAHTRLDAAIELMVRYWCSTQ
jgi:hypothetical protein